MDDCVRENADFQYKAGLSPKIERRTVGKCCEWCSKLAGTYEYDDVKDRGNDVFRRHKNCHCIVSYNPGDGSKRRQNVHTGRWTTEQDPDIIESRKNTGMDGGEFRKRAAFNSKDDPMADAFGRGIDSNPKEIEAFRNECESNGVTIIEREHESLSYQANPVRGNPGQITVSPNASFAAWCHEMQHMRDDKASGWQGAVIAWDRQEHIKWEERAYGIEIRMAEEAGRHDIAEKLQENLETERRRLNDSP